MSYDHDEYVQMVTDCENRESKLTDWERTFVDSILNQLIKGYPLLSNPQIDTLNDIWDRVT